MLIDQIVAPVSASSFRSLLPKSPKYTAPSTTAGVAETSPFVVAIHFGASRWTFFGLIVCSNGWSRELVGSWPIIGQSCLSVFANVCAAPASAASATTAAVSRNLRGCGPRGAGLLRWALVNIDPSSSRNPHFV
jgi:hypothetical protein